MFCVAVLFSAGLSAAPGLEAEFNEVPDRGSSASERAWAVGVAAGRGVRFNNPYRLSRPLGSSPASVSLTAPYLESMGRVSWPGSIAHRHGVQLGLGFALNGITQWVVVPSYWLSFADSGNWQITARAGVPLILAPDFNLGGELAGGIRRELWPGFFLDVELLASLFIGAAVPDSSFTLYPLLSLQAGVSYRFGEQW